MDKKSIKFQFKRCCAMLLVIAMFLTSFAISPDSADAANKSKYWIKVNKKANVATVYQLKGGKYKPIKAMLTSCGGKDTPSGTFYTPSKYRWHTLMGPSYGQYCTRVTGSILFHSVWYYKNGNKASQSTREFNRLGQTASHGCIRLSVGDAKWIYDNCKLKTKVTIYSSKKPGPLGKPKAIKVATSRRTYWDPTDPDKRNPYRKKKAKIYISSKKDKYLEYNQKYSVKSGVSAKDQITKKSLTKKITYKAYKYSKGKYRRANFTTKSVGTYKIRYYVKSSLGATTAKDLKIKIVDTKAPIISAKNYNVRVGDTNAVQGVSAKMRSGTSRTKYMTVKIKAPGSSKYATYTYSKAKGYKFTKAGTYYVKYYVKNKNKPYRQATRSIKISSYKDAVISGNNVTVPYNATDVDMINAIRSKVSVSDSGTTIARTSSKVAVNLTNDTNGNAVATVSYRCKNGRTISKNFSVTRKQAPVPTPDSSSTPVEVV